MFDSIRKHQRILQFVLLLLIFPAFAFFGVSGYQRFMADDDSVASVAGTKITRQEYDQAMNRQLERMREVLGGQIDPKMLDTAAARGEVLDGLIAQRALLVEAQSRHVAVGDAALRQTIGAIPGLRKPDGSFDLERYQAMLRSQGMNEAMFEDQLRRDLALQVLPEAAARTALLPSAVLDRMIALQEQVREVREQTFRPADFAAQVKPTDEQLKKYYEEHAQAYEMPEAAKVEYLVLSAASIASQVALNADDVRTYFEQNKAKYATAEERRASHVLIKVDAGASEAERKAARAKAEDILKQARAGGDFAALARTHSQDPGSASSGGDLGFFTRDTMVKPFADAAFTLKEGELSGVVESEFGYHVIKLTGIKPGAGRSFEQVRPELEAELRQQEATKRFAEAADTFSNLVYEQSDSLKPAAERFKLTIQTADNVNRQGSGLPPKTPLAAPKLLAALFSADSLKTKRNTEAVEVGGNTLVAARIVDYRPAQRKPFEAVADEVRKAVVEVEARKLAQQAGEARLKALRDGAPLTGLSDPKPVSRAAQPSLPPQAVEAVFRAPTGKLPSFAGVDLGPAGYGVYAVVKVEEPSAEAVAQRRPMYQAQLAQIVAQQDATDYVESLKARSKVVRHPERIAPKTEAR